MAKFIRCPRCQSEIDVTSLAGGSTVKCGDCQATLRVPTGNTGVRQAVPAAAAAEAPRNRAGGRQSPLFKKFSNVRAPGSGNRPPSRSAVDSERGGPPRRSSKGNGPMIAVGAGVGAIVLVALLIMQVQGKKNAQIRVDAERAANNERIRKENAEKQKKWAEEAAAEEAREKAEQEAAKKAAKGNPSLQKKAGGGYTAPATFEPGAKKYCRVDGPAVDAALTPQYEAMASSGKAADIVKDVAKWFPYVVHGLASEKEDVARGSFTALVQFCASKGLTTESGKSPIAMELFNSAQYRGGAFTEWSDWLEKPQNRIAIGAGTDKDKEEIRTKGENPSNANWDSLMKDLRAGGAFDDDTRPEGRAFARVKGMGRDAYTHLIGYIDNEDVLLGRAAVTVLNTLTGRQSPLPTEANKAATKSEWENWLKNN